jgi:50S ribosomal subunit-associated GTPase HflX
MDKNKIDKQSPEQTLAEVTKEMAKPRVAMSAREQPMELLREKIAEELASPSQASTGMVLTPNLSTCIKSLGVRATLVT